MLATQPRLDSSTVQAPERSDSSQEMTILTDWRAELRRLHDNALPFDWETHLTTLNARYRLAGDDILSTTDTGLPPAWFNGDLEVITQGRWVLVVSLNPGKPEAGAYGNALRRDNTWDFWRRHNEGKWWYWRFFRPLVQLAAQALGEDVTRTDEPLFATERMVFIELCPYASRKFKLAPDVIAELSREDPGFFIAQKFRRILIEQAEPAVVLINGVPAIRDVELLDVDRLAWEEIRYTSPTNLFRGRPKQLWHKQGIYAASHGPVPTIGFPFLKKAATHNSALELAQLGQHIRTFLLQTQRQ